LERIDNMPDLDDTKVAWDKVILKTTKGSVELSVDGGTVTASAAVDKAPVAPATVPVTPAVAPEATPAPVAITSVPAAPVAQVGETKPPVAAVAAQVAKTAYTVFKGAGQVSTNFLKGFLNK
jgi:hypothetical protein